MIIELRGVDFVNKGSQLMFHAIISKVKEEIPDPVFVMENTTFAPRSKHLEFGIFTKTNFKIFKIPLHYIFGLIPVFFRRRWNYINEQEIEVVLDASGFALGDPWGAKKASRRLGDHVAKWNQEGKTVILLPQAYGPFLKMDLVTVMKTIIEYVDMIFVRDKISNQYLKELGGNNIKFNLAPDFTNLLLGSVPLYFDTTVCEVAIIVNRKMIETTKEKDGEAYLDLLFRMINMIVTLGYKPFFLIHEGNLDRRVAEEVNEKLSIKLPIIQDDNPLNVKGIIANSKAVITSRFHGLVSCLSQGIPCLATGWNHKYQMLLKDYNYEEGMVDVTCDNELLLMKLKAILTMPSKYLIIQKLMCESAHQKKRSEEMWQKVFNKIKNKYNYIPLFTSALPPKMYLINSI